MHRLGCSWQLTHVDLRWFMMVLHCVSTWFNAFQHGFTLPCSGRQWRSLSYTCLDTLGCDAAPNSFTKWYAMSSRSLLNSDLNKISFERGPQGERGPGLEASKINFDRVFAFV
jgi:hypothetical protein